MLTSFPGGGHSRLGGKGYKFIEWIDIFFWWGGYVSLEGGSTTRFMVKGGVTKKDNKYVVSTGM